jgi:ribulose-phosphate 3-epimerase
MIDILPAVLPQSFKELEEKLALIAGVSKHVQIDVVDGHFAKPKTWPYRDHASFEKIVQEEHGLPFWDKLNFQFDLMIEHPEVELQNYLQAGASQVVLHMHAAGTPAALQLMVDKRTDELGTFVVRAGVALGPNDQPDLLEQFEAQFDFVQVMGIDRIGRQGEPFDRKALYLVERIRSRYPQLPIQVDGGVTLENARELAGAGATRLIAGSAIFGADDPVAAYKALYNKVNAH